ncbi:MAG: NlpC/P60 family [bacterium]
MGQGHDVAVSLRRSTTIAAIVLAAGFAAMPGAVAGGATGSASVRDRALSWAVARDGLHEIGTSNCSPQINRWERDMGLKVPPCRVWCGAFVHEAYRQAGVQLSRRLIDPDLSFGDAVAGRRGLKSIPISKIQRGDIVFYKFREGVRASHLGIARARPSGGMLATVEGNTSHAVRLERRGAQYIVLAARVTGDG